MTRVPTCSTDGAGYRVAIVAAQWYDDIMSSLIENARRELRVSGVKDVEVYRVPGSFELPVVSLHAAQSPRFDAVVAFGTVIRGETPHFDYVCQAATDGLLHVGLSTGKPVGFGLLTCDTVEQARDRAGLPGSRDNTGASTVRAVLASLQAIHNIRRG